MEGPMPRVALLAEFEVGVEHLDAFLAAARREAKAVRRDEPGCPLFEVMLLDGEEGRGVFVELFEDRDAAAAHRTTPHFVAFHAETAGLGVRWSSRRGVVLEV
jgi:quinol monooxygenase YgiN